MQITQILTKSLTRCGIEGVSKKRLLRMVATWVAEQRPELDTDAIFDGLIQREKLGSTGIGHGVAIPHCRAKGCDSMIGAFLTLAKPIDFDAIDRQPIDLAFVLIVPTESHQNHLDALAEIATLFSNDEVRNALRNIDSDAMLFDAITECTQVSESP